MLSFCLHSKSEEDIEFRIRLIIKSIHTHTDEYNDPLGGLGTKLRL